MPALNMDFSKNDGSSGLNHTFTNTRMQDMLQVEELRLEYGIHNVAGFID